MKKYFMLLASVLNLLAGLFFLIIAHIRYREGAIEIDSTIAVALVGFIALVASRLYYNLYKRLT